MAVTSATALVPIAPGQRAALTSALAALDAADPFASITGVHVARVEVIEDRGPDGTVLLGFSCDGAVVDVLRALVALPVTAAVWAGCIGYPGDASAEAVVRWLEAHLVPPSIAFLTYPGTVAELRGALATHERFRAFAHRAQSLSPAELRAAFLQEFGR